MKLAIRVFAIYTLMLSLIPCGDGGSGILEIANYFLGIEHHHISNHAQHSNGCGDDTCSPFCICSCCSISIKITDNINFTDKYKIVISQKLPSFKSNFYPSGFNASIWQPPRFS